MEFIHIALIRYKQWLSIKSLKENEFYSPTYDIDVVWHAHQGNTEVYRIDTGLGSIFNFDTGLRGCFGGRHELKLWSVPGPYPKLRVQTFHCLKINQYKNIFLEKCSIMTTL